MARLTPGGDRTSISATHMGRTSGAKRVHFMEVRWERMSRPRSKIAMAREPIAAGGGHYRVLARGRGRPRRPSRSPENGGPPRTREQRSPWARRRVRRPTPAGASTEPGHVSGGCSWRVRDVAETPYGPQANPLGAQLGHVDVDRAWPSIRVA